MNFNDAGRGEFLNGVVARRRTDVEQCVEGVPLYSVSWTQPARFFHLERHVDDPLLLQMLAPKFAQA
jgi:hypothetical protein